jgi:excisionase family DNA binding protein
LAELLSLSPSYISKLVKEDGLPSYKIGKSLRFKIMEVLEFLNERKRP